MIVQGKRWQWRRGDSCDTVGDLNSVENVGVGISSPNFKLEVGGSIFINSAPNNGALILKSQDGSCWKMVATDDGTINLIKTDCDN